MGRAWLEFERPRFLCRSSSRRGAHRRVSCNIGFPAALKATLPLGHKKCSNLLFHMPLFAMRPPRSMPTVHRRTPRVGQPALPNSAGVDSSRQEGRSVSKTSIGKAANKLSDRGGGFAMASIGVNGPAIEPYSFRGKNGGACECAHGDRPQQCGGRDNV
jgi:hypothetical protein